MINSPDLIPELGRNERRILDLIFRGKAVTQSALVEETQLTQQSVSRIVAQLTETCLIEPGGKVDKIRRRGYASTALQTRPDYCFTIGLSIMAGAMTAVLSDFSGAVRAREHSPITSLTIEQGLFWSDSTIDALCRTARISRNLIVGIGVSIAGSFIEGGRFNTPPYLEEWAGKDVPVLFSDHFQLPCYADNDGNAAALAEAQSGIGRWAGSFAYLYISAGVGGGVILDGHLWRGRHGNAGEFAGGLPSNIFPFPNLELLRQLVVRSGIELETVNDLADRFDPSWAAIDEWIVRVRDSLSIIASNATAILDLDAIALGGLMPVELAERVIPHIELFDQRRRGVARPVAKIVPAEAGPHAAATGSALLPLKRLFFE